MWAIVREHPFSSPHPVQAPAVVNAFHLVLASVLELDAGAGHPATLNAPSLAADHVLSETRPVSDDRDTAEACIEHPSCIRGFIAKPRYGYPNAAGWWHLEWDEADEVWHVTDPGGGTKDVQVRGEEKLTPPVALVGAFQYVPFHGVVEAIRRKGLFPPEPV